MSIISGRLGVDINYTSLCFCLHCSFIHKISDLLEPFKKWRYINIFRIDWTDYVSLYWSYNKLKNHLATCSIIFTVVYIMHNVSFICIKHNMAAWEWGNLFFGNYCKRYGRHSARSGLKLLDEMNLYDETHILIFWKKKILVQKDKQKCDKSIIENWLNNIQHLNLEL